MNSVRILVVEGEGFIRALMVNALIDAGFKVDDTGNSDAALRLLDADGYQVLITGAYLPGKLSGLELAARSGQVEPDLPVVMIARQASQVAKFQEAGMNLKALGNPFDTEELVAIVKSLVKRATL
jgi:DNA-binding response OmpR family regulator